MSVYSERAQIHEAAAYELLELGKTPRPLPGAVVTRGLPRQRAAEWRAIDVAAAQVEATLAVADRLADLAETVWTAQGLSRSG